MSNVLQREQSEKVPLHPFELSQASGISSLKIQQERISNVEFQNNVTRNYSIGTGMVGPVAFPLAKLAVVAVRQASRPLARVVENLAHRSSTFRFFPKKILSQSNGLSQEYGLSAIGPVLPLL